MNLRFALLGVLMLAGSACIEDDTEVARDPVRVPTVTPTAIAALPGGIEVAQLAINDGSFVVEEVVLQQLEPTILEVINHDDRPYRLRIGDLLTVTEIPADTTRRIEFTTPSAMIYTGELVAAESDDVLDEVFVTVQDEGATEP